MAELYDYVKEEKLNQSFFDALVSDATCRIDGVAVVKKGTPEWKDYLESKRRAFAGITPQEELDRMISRMDASREMYMTYTGQLFAVHFRQFETNPNRYISKRVIFDKRSNTAAEVSVSTKRVDVFSMGHWPGELRELKIVNSNILNYAGSFQDALYEFEKNGYLFNLWNNVNWDKWNLENGKRTRRLERATPVEGVSLDRILSSPS